MARIVKEYAERRNEILDAAQQLVLTKGYEQMTIQDILDMLHISKGAFYHYFDAKQALLEAIIERMTEEVKQLLMPIVNNGDLLTLEKLNIFFAMIGLWKTEQKDFLLAMLRVWYLDHNALVRQKVLAASVKQITPMLTLIINQGVQEGVLTTSYPEQVGEMVLTLTQGLGDTLARLLLSIDEEYNDLQYINHIVAAYTDALERILGAPTGSLHLVDSQMLKQWFHSKE